MSEVTIEIVFVADLDFARLARQCTSLLTFSVSFLFVVPHGFGDGHGVRRAQIRQISEFFADERWVLHRFQLRELLFSLLLLLDAELLFELLAFLRTWRVRGRNERVTRRVRDHRD